MAHLRRAEVHSPLGRLTATSIQRSRARVPRAGYRRLRAYAIVYILEGHGWYEDENGTSLHVGAGHLIQIFPSLGHAYGPESGEPWVERYIVFEGPVFSLWEECGLLDARRPVLHLSPASEWYTRIDHLFGGSGRLGVLSELEETCRLQEFLALALAASRMGVEVSCEDRIWLAAACALLGSGDQAGERPLSLEAVADSLSLSYDGFRKRFRRLDGLSPARFRAQQSIDRACAMLQTGSMTNRQIAESLGFCDESHFSKRFKQLKGYSPQEYRARLPLT
jgi:AraC-like DNA-binding protein